MANVIRAGLTEGLVADVATSYLVLAGYTLVSVLVAAWVIGRRG
jgi:hypothetical protein